MSVRSLGREDPPEEKMATLSSILLGKSHGQRSLAGYSPWGHKELDMTEQLTLSHFHFAVLQDKLWRPAGQPEDHICPTTPDLTPCQPTMQRLP